MNEYESYSTNPKLQPLSEMPIWARLDFAQMIPRVYFWDHMSDDPKNPRRMSDVTVQGFERVNDFAWIYYTMDWIEDGESITNAYLWPAIKNPILQAKFGGYR